MLLILGEALSDMAGSQPSRSSKWIEKVSRLFLGFVNVECSQRVMYLATYLFLSTL